MELTIHVFYILHEFPWNGQHIHLFIYESTMNFLIFCHAIKILFGNFFILLQHTGKKLEN